MRILILSHDRDVHAQSVSAELSRRGVTSDLRCFSDWPEAFGATLSAGGGVGSSELGGVPTMDYRAVWLRRPGQPRLSDDLFHEADRSALLADQTIFSEWFHQALAPEAKWVNRWGVHLSASNKMAQMGAAAAAGLLIPHTLFSTDPHRIRAFVREGATVSKPISRRSLANEGLVLGTRLIREGDLPPDEQLRLQPCFLQRVIAKRAEYRVHVMGDELTAVRFRPASPQEHGDIDWNFGRETDRFLAEAVTLDAEVHDRVLDVCRRLGVVFACVDLVEDAEGRSHFLELNQMGQFLWVEHRLPGVKLVGKFCDLLLS